MKIKIKTITTLLAMLMLIALTTSSISGDAVKDSYVLQYNGKYAKALSTINKALQKNKRSYFLQVRSAYLTYLLAKYVQSAKAYQKAIALAPDAIEPRLGLLNSYMALGKYKQVQTVAKAILNKDRQNYTALSKLAYALYLSKQYKRAAKKYASLIRLYPSDGNMLKGLGFTYLKLKNKRAAKRYLLRAQTILPYDNVIKAALK